MVGDRYALKERLGAGESSVIYRGEHVTLGREVAVKLLHESLSRDEWAIERARREATTVSRIDNEHIVEIYDFGRAPDGRLYLAMELLLGEPLAGVLAREGRLTVDRAVEILVQLGEALMEAHAIGYLHRDLRPRNVFLASRRGRGDFVKLLDFGLAKLVEREGEAASTSLGMNFGDPKYMSPEQARGDPLDRRADIYSLGCMAYEMITGEPPFSGERVFDILTRHVQEEPAPLRARRRDAPAWLESAVARMLAKRPDDRFITVYRLVEALRAGRDRGEVMEGALARRPESEPPPSVSRAMAKLAARDAADDVDPVDWPDDGPGEAGAPAGESQGRGEARSDRAGEAAGPGLGAAGTASGAREGPGEGSQRPAGAAEEGAGEPRWARAAGGPERPGRPSASVVAEPRPSGASEPFFASGEALEDEREAGSGRGESSGVGLSPSETGLVAAQEDRSRRAAWIVGAAVAGALAFVALALVWPVVADDDDGEAAGPADAGLAAALGAHEGAQDAGAGREDGAEAGEAAGDDDAESAERENEEERATAGGGERAAGGESGAAASGARAGSGAAGRDRGPPEGERGGASSGGERESDTGGGEPATGEPGSGESSEGGRGFAGIGRDDDASGAGEDDPGEDDPGEDDAGGEGDADDEGGFVEDEEEEVSEDEARAASLVAEGRDALGAGDVLTAAARFNEAYSLDPRNAGAVSGLGEIALRQGHGDDAVGHLEDAVSLDPGNPRLQTLLGEAYMAAGRPERAAERFERALQLDPDNRRAREGYEEAAGEPF